NNCEFYPCPELPPATQPPPGAQYCDATIKCSEGMECYDFPDQDKPICYPGDPCNWCPTGKCILLESYPPQVRCE
ncbi:MAG: hypothetical protein ABIH63_01560, partial [archaeon]